MRSSFFTTAILACLPIFFPFGTPFSVQVYMSVDDPSPTDPAVNVILFPQPYWSGSVVPFIAVHEQCQNLDSRLSHHVASAHFHSEAIARCLFYSEDECRGNVIFDVKGRSYPLLSEGVGFVSFRCEVNSGETDGAAVPATNLRGGVKSSDKWSSDENVILFSEPDFLGQVESFILHDASCQSVTNLAYHIGSIIIYSNYLDSCLFYTNKVCEVKARGDVLSVRAIEYASFAEGDSFGSFRCYPKHSYDNKESFTQLLATSRKKPNYMSKPAKVTLYNDFDFKGEKKTFDVLNSTTCFDLPNRLSKYVLSAKLDPKIWYCSFFPEKECGLGHKEGVNSRSEEVYQLTAGEYDNVFPDGMDFVSFRCVVYEDKPEV